MLILLDRIQNNSVESDGELRLAQRNEKKKVMFTYTKGKNIRPVIQILARCEVPGKWL